MRFIFGKRNVRHFVRILQSFSRMTEELRFMSVGDDALRIEAVKDRVAFGTITVKRGFFEFFSPGEAIDVIFTSRLAFRNANHIAKKLIRMDVTIRKGDDHAVFRQAMTMYDRITRIPFQNRITVNDVDFGPYEKYPTHLRCLVKLFADGMRHFPSSIELVTMRIRNHNVKVETGDEEADAEFMTKFNFFIEEFETYTHEEDVTVTFSLKLLKQFLSAWDKKSQYMSSYFKEQSGIVFVFENSGFTTQIMICCVMKHHPPNSPVRDGNETMTSTNITYITDTSGQNRSVSNFSVSNISISDDQGDRFEFSMDQSIAMPSGVSATAGISDQLPDDDVEQFDDSLDGICSGIPDPSVQLISAQVPRTSTAVGHRSGQRQSLNFQPTPAPALREAIAATQESFDSQVYKDLLVDSVLRMSRKIVGLDETMPSTISHREVYEPEPDVDSEDDQIIFDQ